MRLVALVGSLLLSGCILHANTATIYRNSLPTYEARIVDGDAEAIVIADENGGRHRVPRRELNRIDHPGDIVALVGLVGMGWAGVVFADTLGDYPYDDQERDIHRWGAGGVGALAAVVFFSGLSAWWSSRAAVERR